MLKLHFFIDARHLEPITSSLFLFNFRRSVLKGKKVLLVTFIGEKCALNWLPFFRELKPQVVNKRVVEQELRKLHRQLYSTNSGLWIYLTNQHVRWTMWRHTILFHPINYKRNTDSLNSKKNWPQIFTPYFSMLKFWSKY